MGILTGLCNGLFGAGGGMVAAFSLMRFCAYPPEKAHATTIGIILPLSLISAGVYVFQKSVDYAALLFVAPGFTLGSLLGAKLTGKLSGPWLERIFSFLMLLSALFLLWK